MRHLSSFFFASIYRRMLSSFSVVIALILIVSGVNYFQLIRFRELSEEAIPLSNQMGLLQEYVVSLSSLDANLDRLFVIGGAEIRQDIGQDLVNLENSIESISANMPAELVANAQELSDLTAQLDGEVILLADLVSANESPRQINEQALVVFALMDGTQQVHKTLTEASLTQLQTGIRNQDGILTGTISQSTILAVIAIAVSIVASLFISRSIAKPLSLLVDTSAEIAAGNLGATVKVDSQDEIGRLGTAFNTMVHRLQERDKERDQMLRDLRAAKRLADENSRLKSEFLATMSHELRTPLNAIEGFASIMLAGMGVTLEPKVTSMLQRIRANSKRLLGLINDFLDLSRIESGRMELVSEPISLSDLVRNLEAGLGSLATDKGIDFQVSIDPKLPDVVYGDEEAISKIATNLLGNAFKFTQQGNVDLALHRNNGSWEIEVSDTGIGIPPHAREFIFDEFRQVDGSSKREYGGTGLGLAIVQKLTRVMGGTVSLESEVGQGSRFTVSLPLKNGHNGQEQ